MKKKMPTVLVLGATGMLGRIVYSRFIGYNKTNTIGTSRKQVDKLICFKVGDTKTLKKILLQYKPDYVINCIGALKNASELQLTKVNTLFPKKLEKLSHVYGYKLIHISTDAVYSSSKGVVYENSPANAADSYAVSKLNGEVHANSISIRTSILGLDPDEHKGLLEHVLKKEVNKIGYINQIWSGSTTIQLAKFIEDIIYGDLNILFNKTHIINFAPLGPVSKYEIISVFSKIINKQDIKLKSDKSTPKTTILKSLYLNKSILKSYNQDLADSLLELLRHDTNYSKTFKK